VAAHVGGISDCDLNPKTSWLRLGSIAARLPVGASPEDIETLTCLTAGGVILGTAGYMPPEQWLGRPLHQPIDQFSFGALLYEILAGRRAFECQFPPTSSPALSEGALPRVRSVPDGAREVPTAEDAAVSQVVTPPGTCRGLARRFSRSHPEVHAGT
jgi:serine/threonine protein kinase